LIPADGISASQGTQISFSGVSSVPVTFAVASSPTLLSTPDVDAGPGVQQMSSSGGSAYTFTSSKAVATAGTVYWTASISNAGLPDCSDAEPTLYTTKVRTMTVMAPILVTTGIKTRPPAPSLVSVLATNFKVSVAGAAAIELACEGQAPCAGRLRLRVKRVTKKRRGGKIIHTITIATGTFALAAGTRAVVNVPLSAGGRRLLRTAHQHLTAKLQLEQELDVRQTLTKEVRLVRARSTAKSNRGRQSA
jgi:hypothetical protein